MINFYVKFSKNVNYVVKNWSSKEGFFHVAKIATFSYCVTEGIVASLIAAIPQCQTQPIELVYFALAESTSTQCREKNLLAQMEITWKTLTKTLIC